VPEDLPGERLDPGLVHGLRGGGHRVFLLVQGSRRLAIRLG
jgi:hypothetical protein